MSFNTSLPLLVAIVPLHIPVCRAITAGLRNEIGRCGMVQAFLNGYAAVGLCTTLSCVWVRAYARSVVYARPCVTLACTSMPIYGSDALDHKYF